MSAKDAAAATRIHDDIRRRLESGDIAPGQRLDAAQLAQRHGASPTPVRDALARLHGEGLLAATPGRGYAAPALTRASLTGLYLWSDMLMRAVFDAAAPDGRVESIDAGDDLGALMRALAHRRGIGPLTQAVDVACVRLGPLRPSEGAVLRDGAGETRRLCEAVRAGDGRRAFARHHARRLRGLDAILGDALARFANQRGEG